VIQKGFSLRKQIGFSYPGGKQMLAPEIIKFLPKTGRKFIDAFAGRANIALCAMQQGYQYDQWILNDIRTCDFMQAIKTHGHKITVPQRHTIDHHDLSRRVTQGDPEALLLEPYATFNGGGCAAGGSKTLGGRRSPQSYEYVLRGAHKLLTERDVRITNIDWLDCLKTEQPGMDCAVVLDVPYIESHVVAYDKEDICPTEVIDYLQSSQHPWVLCEYEQPLYISGLGEPAYKKTVQLKAANLGATETKQRTECVWMGTGKVQPNVTEAVQPVPEHRTDVYYQTLPLEGLLQEIKKGIDGVTFHRNQIQKELRMRLLPALLELKKRTYRKNPGFYETLKMIGLNGDLVRQWFYRARTADEIIDLIEEEKPEPKLDRDDHGALDAEALLLEHADRMAQAVLDGKITYAKRLATDYVRVRNEDRVL
jgi:hypothetical protein